jgi:hypothetical protein
MSTRVLIKRPQTRSTGPPSPLTARWQLGFSCPLVPCGHCSQGGLHGRVPLYVGTTPHLQPSRCPPKPSSRRDGNQRSPLAPRGDHAPCSQVTCDSPPTPSHHACLLVSALPPRSVRHVQPSPIAVPPPQRANARTRCLLRVTVAPTPSCLGHSTSYTSQRGVERRFDRVREAARRWW